MKRARAGKYNELVNESEQTCVLIRTGVQRGVTDADSDDS